MTNARYTDTSRWYIGVEYIDWHSLTGFEHEKEVITFKRDDDIWLYSVASFQSFGGKWRCVVNRELLKKLESNYQLYLSTLIVE